MRRVHPAGTRGAIAVGWSLSPLEIDTWTRPVTCLSYNVADWKPRVTYRVTYEVDGDVGELGVQQGKRLGVRSDGAYGDSDVILEVDVERGVAEINLEVV